MAIQESSRNDDGSDELEEIKSSYKQVKLLYSQEQAGAHKLSKRGRTFDERKMVEESKEEGKEEESKEEESKEEKLRTMAAPKRKLEYYDENPLLKTVNERDSKKKEAFGKKI